MLIFGFGAAAAEAAVAVPVDAGGLIIRKRFASGLMSHGVPEVGGQSQHSSAISKCDFTPSLAAALPRRRLSGGGLRSFGKTADE